MAQQTPRRGPWSPDEQAALEQALAEGRVNRIPKPPPLEPCPHRIMAGMFAGQRDPRR